MKIGDDRFKLFGDWGTSRPVASKIVQPSIRGRLARLGENILECSSQHFPGSDSGGGDDTGSWKILVFSRAISELL